MHYMKAEEFKRLIACYLNNEVTAEEKELLDRWYYSYEGRPEESLFPDPVEELDIQNGIYDKLTAHRMPPAVRKLRTRRLLFKYAAVVLLLLVSVPVIYTLISSGSSKSLKASAAYSAYSAGTGMVKKLVLPDGSVVWLNALSRIRIGSDYGKHNRKIFLDDGEAFFEVKARKDLPFIVCSQHFETRVLGTSFNISADRGLAIHSVTVKEGKVQVSDGKEVKGILTANNRLVYNHRLHTYTTGISNGAASRTWINGDIYLNEASFDELARTLMKIYGVTLKTEKNASGDAYSLHIRTSRPLAGTMKLVCSIHQNKYRRNGNEIILY